MYHLLIADDEDKIRAGISSYFPWNELGFEVVGLAANGQEAFDRMLDGERVDVLLCDIRMPVVSGLELLDMMQESGISDVKVVFLSGYREFDYAHKALKFGVCDYLLKPTKYKELYDTFSRIKAELDEAKQSLPVPVSAESSASAVSRMKALARAQYRTLSLRAAADAVHLNSFYASKLFKLKTGQNFYEYLLRTRMDIAAELLTGSDCRIYEISEQVGYKNQKSFLKIFKRIHGVNPTDYRKEHRHE